MKCVITLVISLIPKTENLATFFVEVIEPIPPKKVWILYNKSMSFILTSIIYLLWTCHPIELLELFVTNMLKQLSPSENPVTNHGFNWELLFSIEL